MVKGLRANILIGNDIFALENFVLNVGLSYVLVGCCGIKITIRGRQRGQFLRKRLFVEKDKFILLYSDRMIPFLLVTLSDNRDF